MLNILSAAQFHETVTLQAQHKLNFAGSILLNSDRKWQRRTRAKDASRCCVVIFPVVVMRCAIMKHPAVMQPEIRPATLAPPHQHQPCGPSGAGNQWKNLKTAEMAAHGRQKI